MGLYGKDQVRPYVACLPALVQLPLDLAIEALRCDRLLNQGLPDKLAGTIVIAWPNYAAHGYAA